VKLAFKTHQLAWLALAQALLAVIGATLGGTLLELPGLAGSAPLALLIALLGALLVAPPIVRAWPSTRTNASRSPGLITVSIVTLQLIPAVLVASLSTLFGGHSGIPYIGMLLWLLAIQLSVGALVSATYQGVAPAVYVLLCALVGRVDSVIQPWAWPLDSVAPGVYVAIGGAACLLSLTIVATVGLHGRTTE
jgi:hypothetical protein